MLPGRIPNVKDYAKTNLLPSSTRMGVYKEYVRAVTGEALQEATHNINLVRKEREYYTSVLKEAATLFEGLFTDPVTGLYSPPLSIPLAELDIMAHYSCVYAQQVHFPSNPLKPGPIYFLTPRKCGIFGVCCEAIPQQVNFLVDESFLTGKGAYAYLLWRVLTGLNKRITLSLPAGHTKFSPDWCFGLLKQRFRRSVVGSLHDLVEVVERSASVNKAQVVGTVDGECIVKSYDWTGHLAPFFKKIEAIKTFHHFVMDCQAMGEVSIIRTSDDPVVREQLLREPTIIPSTCLPPVVSPTGLSSERQWYLYDMIR
uniref:Uncharacterized protein n=1 Tax=Amphimedon queenslandica TaxID=400682 RepID=A0A1X7T2I0_AMPQE